MKNQTACSFVSWLIGVALLSFTSMAVAFDLKAPCLSPEERSTYGSELKAMFNESKFEEQIDAVKKAEDDVQRSFESYQACMEENYTSQDIISSSLNNALGYCRKEALQHNTNVDKRDRAANRLEIIKQYITMKAQAIRSRYRTCLE